MSERYAVIMAGGKGERFWPASRLRRPKHLLPIVGDKPMLTQTVDRLEGLIPAANIFVITNQEQAAGVREVCPMLPAENVVAEPIGRDTAAAVGLAMLLIQSRDPEAALAMLPADAFITDHAGFRNTLASAFEAAESMDCLATIGIPPAHPATGYGYIRKGEPADASGAAFKVREFKEKPDLETAKRYLESGDYFWNAGMFIWRASVISDALARFAPKLKAGLDELGARLKAGEGLAGLLGELYPSLEKISIDFAVMEKADNAITIPAAFDWDDVGEWPAIERHFPMDSDGNVASGAAVFEGSKGNIAVAEKGHLIAFVGVDDLIAVQTKDATLICKKADAQKIKDLVKRLGADEAMRRLL